MSAPLLVELFTEELPPKALAALSRAFADTLVSGLRDDGFAPPAGAYRAFATPRRLAVLIEDVADKAPDREVLAKGPNVKAGLDASGNPTPALLGFARKHGVDAAVLERVSDGKAEIFVYRSIATGASLDAALEAQVAAAAKALPIPKIMRWGGGESEFVRPVRSVIVLHGARVVPAAVLGLVAGRATRGHRFMGRGGITIPRASDYESLLEQEGKVIADFGRRRALIREHLAEAARGATIAADDALFDEVTALVEYPVVYEGHFDKAFLEVPQECLMLTMRQNQKYFPLLDAGGKLLPRFLLVSNLQTPHPEHIVHGNERVLRARLSDAKFFFDQDRRRSLDSLVPRLADVVFHNRLGSQLERVERIRNLAGVIAARLAADDTLARRAAWLCKADLLTGMVGEFPELQGTMGTYYARHDGEPDAVAEAIAAHYHPRFAGDSLPAERPGECVALADKLDLLVGIWGIGLVPTGEKDPFGLRRAALGVLRILAERELPLDLLDVLEIAYAGYGPGSLDTATVPALHAFMLDRLRGYLRERGHAPDEIESVLAQAPTRIDLVVPRLLAVASFRRLPEAESLAAANKRTANILKKAEIEAGVPDPALLGEPAEKALFQAIATVRPEVEAKAASLEYAESLRLLARLRPQVDAFFDQVLVNVEDPALRRNRLLLLADLQTLLNRVADISKLAT